MFKKKIIMMFSENAASVKALSTAARHLIDEFPGRRVFAFYGKMGAGKTTFIQAVCQVLGTSDNVTSPTFAIINEYNTELGESIYHFDFYRIKDMEEAFDMGYEDYFFSGSWCLIEWPEKIEPLLPEGYVKVTISVEDDESRKITATF
jgi:tRNA threonylcarbamoyladenosine biosynthesis protein TsaE